MSAPIGPWRMSERVSDAVVSDQPLREGEGVSHVDYYGGHLVAESIPARFRPLIAAAPELLAALRHATPPLPPPDAMCHAGIVPQSECRHCQRIAKVLAIIAKASGGAA